MIESHDRLNFDSKRYNSKINLTTEDQLISLVSGIEKAEESGEFSEMFEAAMDLSNELKQNKKLF